MSDETGQRCRSSASPVTEGTVGAGLKEVGEAVAFDDPLFEVSTDKVDSEIPSPYDGVLLQVLVPPGETVPVGRRCASAAEELRSRTAVRRRRHAVAAAGGRSSPSRRRRRWADRRGRPPRRPVLDRGRRGLRGRDAEARRVRHRGHRRPLAQAGRRAGRVRRPALRGVHRQGRLRDTQPVRRHVLEILVPKGRPCRSAPRWPASAPRRSAATRRRPQRCQPAFTAAETVVAAAAHPGAGRRQREGDAVPRRPAAGRRARPRPRRRLPAAAPAGGSGARTSAGRRRAVRRSAPPLRHPSHPRRPGHRAAPAAPAAAKAVKGPADGPRRSGAAEPDTARCRRPVKSSRPWRPRSGPRSRWTSRRRAGPGQSTRRSSKGHRGVAELPAVHFPRGVRSPAGIPDGQLLDRPRSQDDDVAPVRQPRHRRRFGWAGPGRAGRQGTPTR